MFKKNNFLFLAFAGFFSSIYAQEPSIDVLVPGKTKALLSYSAGDDFKAFLKDTKLGGDTLVSVFIEGSIQTIEEKSMNLTYYTIIKDYRINGKRLYIQNEFVNSEPDAFYKVSFSDITGILAEYKAKKIGRSMALLGGAGFLAAPFLSINPTEWTDFKAERYKFTAGVSLGVAAVGIGMMLPFKKREISIQERDKCEECDSKTKFIDGRIVFIPSR